MAYFIDKPRWSDTWTIYCDDSSDTSEVQALDGIPVGSKMIEAADSAAPTEYTLFPSDWVQTGGTFS